MLTNIYKICTIKITNANSLRYLGYYLDSETGYYYLQSRYYDPSICRFINADDISYLNINDYSGLNLFAYCCNDSINNYDSTGHYKASSAKAYAEKWWKGRNTKQYKTNKYDCANFVSQCLYAGYLSGMTNQWYHKKKNGRLQISKSWGKAHNLYHWLYDYNHCNKYFSANNNSRLQTALEFLYKYRNYYCSAAIFFDWTSDGEIDHAALSGQIERKKVKNKYVYDLYYYAHTSERNGKKTQYIDKNGKKYYQPLSKSLNTKTWIFIMVLK